MATNAVASISLTADHSRLAAGLRAASGLVHSWASSTRNAMAGLSLAPGRALGNIGKSMLTLGSFSIASRGLDMLVDAGKSVIDFERKLTRFGIATRIGKEGLNEYRKAARATSVETGIDAGVVLDSARAYTDLAGAQNTSIDKMRILARAGQASDAEGKDLAGMMYQLTRSMKVADGQMEDTMGGLINQAKDGAIEAKQMAAEFAGMMPIFARFGVTGREGAVQLGAMYQVTRDGFDSAAQAATGMIRLMAGFQRHASRFEKFGVNVFKPGSKKDLRDLSDIMEQVKKSPLSKDIEALIKAFGRSEAWRTFELLAEAPARLKELEESGRRNGVIQEDLATQVESVGGRLDIAGAKMKQAFADVLTPERIDQVVSGIQSIAEALPAVMSAVSGIASGFGSFVHMVTRLKNTLQGDSKYEPETAREANAVLYYTTNRKHRLSPEDVKLAEASLLKKKNYDQAIDEIMGLENDFGATDASIKKAIQFAHSWRGTGPSMPGDSASIAYLKGRDKEISPTRYRRLDAEVTAEENKLKQKQYVDEHVKPIVDAVGKQLGDAISRAIHTKPTTLTMDGNPVAKVSGNATDHRRK